MYEVEITVKKVMGVCTADPPVEEGESFTVSEGDIRIPEGGCVCLYALQSLIPLIPAKERKIAENRDEDWMWRVHHAQCPDPKGRVVFTIEQKPFGGGIADSELSPGSGEPDPGSSEASELKALKVVVESVGGKCTSRMKPGDYAILRGGRLYIPPGRCFCLYALQSALPLLPAKQRHPRAGDWMKDECRVLCPDPAGNVILRIDELDG